MSRIPSSFAVTGRAIHPLSGIASLFSTAVRALRRWHQQRRAIRRLHQLDDHMLKDIGISRSEISSVVHGDRTDRRRPHSDFGRSGPVTWG